MKINLKPITKEQIEACTAAARETQITVKQLIDEIAPLIEKCFLADIKICRKSLKMTFCNNQTFTLYIRKE